MINSIGNKFRRSWEITKRTFAVMKHDKEILLFPILSSIFSVILFFILVFPIFLAQFFEEATILVYAGIFVFYFATAFVTTFFNAGIVYIAKTRFEGGNATFMDGIKAGFKHFKQLLGWSLLTATVGLILNILESQAEQKKGIFGIIGKILIRLTGLAWAIVSVFVVPAIVLKGEGPIKALKSSFAAMRKTWGESLIKHYGIGLVQTILLFLGVFFLLFPALFLLWISSALGWIFLGIFILYFVLVLVIFSSANTIFNTALFIYANEGKVPHFYTKEELEQAFVETKKSA